MKQTNTSKILVFIVMTAIIAAMLFGGKKIFMDGVQDGRQVKEAVK